jgi:hypothetical protein
MARILLKTTIAPEPDDWSIARFSLLKAELEAAGNSVTARDRTENAAGNDPDFAALAEGGWDQLWLFAVDVTGALTSADCVAIRRFLARPVAGALLTRDHQDMGSCLLNLGLPGQAHNFHSRNPEADTERQCRDDVVTDYLDWPNYHSGANGDFQQIEVLQPGHPLLAGGIARLPAHPHEGAVSVPPGAEGFAKVVARGRSLVTGRAFNLMIALDRHPEEGAPVGRVVAEATFHRFADANWDPSLGCPSFVTEAPGTGYRDHPDALAEARTYVRNIAGWLAA